MQQSITLQTFSSKQWKTQILSQNYDIHKVSTLFESSGKNTYEQTQDNLIIICIFAIDLGSLKKLI